ncbi:MAG TPA: aminotransferase class IV, partial [Paracoccus sp. (in: a-proteobacteria)]|nr:aminotransferase class IV [Paracoccus sp. (in: a-proteobacteria)]
MESPLHAGSDDPGLRLIETVLWDGRAAPRAGGHLARLAAGAAALGWPCDMARARELLAGQPGTPARLRLTLARDGALERTTGPLPPPVPVWRLGLAEGRLSSGDP